MVCLYILSREMPFFKEERRRMTKIIVLDLCNNLLKLLYYCFPGGFFCVKLCQMSKGEVVNFQLLILSKDLMRRMIKNVGISQALTLIFYEVGLTHQCIVLLFYKLTST